MAGIRKHVANRFDSSCDEAAYCRKRPVAQCQSPGGILRKLPARLPLAKANNLRSTSTADGRFVIAVTIRGTNASARLGVGTELRVEDGRVTLVFGELGRFPLVGPEPIVADASGNGGQLKEVFWGRDLASCVMVNADGDSFKVQADTVANRLKSIAITRLDDDEAEMERMTITLLSAKHIRVDWR